MILCCRPRPPRSDRRCAVYLARHVGVRRIVATRDAKRGRGVRYVVSGVVQRAPTNIEPLHAVFREHAHKRVLQSQAKPSQAKLYRVSVHESVV